MGFQASLCFFFLLTFAIMCFARNIPSENVAAFSTEDYGPPGSNPKHNPHPPPPNFPSETVAAFSTEDYGPPGPNPKHNPPPPPHPAHVVDVNSPPNPEYFVEDYGQGHSPETGKGSGGSG